MWVNVNCYFCGGCQGECFNAGSVLSGWKRVGCAGFTSRLLSLGTAAIGSCLCGLNASLAPEGLVTFPAVFMMVSPASGEENTNFCKLSVKEDLQCFRGRGRNWHASPLRCFVLWPPCSLARCAPGSRRLLSCWRCLSPLPAFSTSLIKGSCLLFSCCKCEYLTALSLELNNKTGWPRSGFLCV